MTWVRIDDGLPDNRKVSSLSDRAFRLYIEALCFCSRNLTDGTLTARELVRVAARSKDLDELLNSGLWERKADGTIEVHDYLEYNPTRAKVEADRKANAERVKAHRKKDSNAVTSTAQPDAETDAVIRPRPVPIPVPSGSVDLNRPPENLSGSDAREASAGDGGIFSDPGRETVCPLNLVEKAEAAGILAELAEKLPAPIESVRHEASDFVAYWTIGAGAQRKRTGWMAKLRQRILDRHREGKLTPPGEVRHSEVRPIPMPKQPRKKRAQEPPLPSPEEQKLMAEMALESFRRQAQ